MGRSARGRPGLEFGRSRSQGHVRIQRRLIKELNGARQSVLDLDPAIDREVPIAARSAGFVLRIVDFPQDVWAARELESSATVLWIAPMTEKRSVCSLSSMNTREKVSPFM